MPTEKMSNEIRQTVAGTQAVTGMNNLNSPKSVITDATGRAKSVQDTRFVLRNKRTGGQVILGVH